MWTDMAMQLSVLPLTYISQHRIPPTKFLISTTPSVSTVATSAPEHPQSPSSAAPSKLGDLAAAAKSQIPLDKSYWIYVNIVQDIGNGSLLGQTTNGQDYYFPKVRWMPQFLNNDTTQSPCYTYIRESQTVYCTHKLEPNDYEEGKGKGRSGPSHPESSYSKMLSGGEPLHQQEQFDVGTSYSGGDSMAEIGPSHQPEPQLDVEQSYGGEKTRTTENRKKWHNVNFNRKGDVIDFLDRQGHHRKTTRRKDWGRRSHEGMDVYVYEGGKTLYFTQKL